MEPSIKKEGGIIIISLDINLSVKGEVKIILKKKNGLVEEWTESNSFTEDLWLDILDNGFSMDRSTSDCKLLSSGTSLIVKGKSGTAFNIGSSSYQECTFDFAARSAYLLHLLLPFHMP